MVRVHPLTGERGLFIGGFAQRIVGLSKGESKDILKILQQYVTRPENVLRVTWEPGQLVLFDNRITQHYAPDNYDGQPRRLNRVTVAGDIPVGSTAAPAIPSRAMPPPIPRRSFCPQTCPEPGCERGTAAAPQRVPDEHRPPRGLVAAAGERPASPTPTSRTTSGSPRSPSAATFDSIFFADSPVLLRRRRPAAVGAARADRAAHRDRRGRPSRIGLIATASTTYNDPYNLARRFASLDHVSGGRAGLEHRHHRRSRRRPQLRSLTTSRRTPRATSGPPSSSRSPKLWDSWDDDALVARQGGGRLGRQRQGPRRSTTRARTSGARARSTCRARRRATRCWCRPGRRRTARTSPPATPRRSSPPSRRSTDAQAFYADLKAAPRALGRDPDRIKSCPASCRSSADRGRGARLEDELDGLIRPEYARRSWRTSPAPRAGGPRARRAAARRPADRGRDRGRQEPLHPDRRAGPARAADGAPAHRPARRRPRTPHLRRHARAGRRRIEDWFAGGAADGFNIMPPVLPVRAGGLRRPRRADPAGARPFPPRVHRTTLRDHYGLPRPANTFSSACPVRAGLSGQSGTYAARNRELLVPER